MAEISLHGFRKRQQKPNFEAFFAKSTWIGGAYWRRRFFFIMVNPVDGTKGSRMRRLFLTAAVALLAACGGGETSGDIITEPVPETTPEPPAPMVIDITGEACGGSSGVQCPGNFYCEQPMGECLEIWDGPGTCQPKAEMCTREFVPVCGCDGQTYGNACEAAAAGISVAAAGECATLDTD